MAASSTRVRLSGCRSTAATSWSSHFWLPGAAPAAQGSASSLRGDFAFNVNGARDDAQSFVLDGFYNIDPKLNTPGVQPPVDGIREFEVLTSTYDASFGRNAAGQVNVVTHSGTNALRGTVYGFFRSEALDARNYFAPENEAAPDYSRQQFGGSVGGPIVRDRTFFFADYERTRLREGITRISNVPTLAERNGDFSQQPEAAAHQPLHAVSRFRATAAGSLHQPDWPAIAALYPEPNRNTPSANFVSSPTKSDDIDQFDARVDHAFAGRVDADGALQLERPAPLRAVPFARERARVWHRRAAPGAEPRRGVHAALRRDAHERGACRLQPGGHRRLPGEPGHQPQSAGGAAGALLEPAGISG